MYWNKNEILLINSMPTQAHYPSHPTRAKKNSLSCTHQHTQYTDLTCSCK